MRDHTRAWHDLIEDLGRTAGFISSTEEAGSILPRQGEADYAPRIDVMWWIGLSAKQKHAIAWATGFPADSIGDLPAVGWEVEGTDPTTKTMTSDAANLSASGCLLGVLVVSERSVRAKGEKGIYARASRVVRSVRRYFGALPLLTADGDWLPEIRDLDWSVGSPRALKPGKGSRGSGGERGDWARNARRVLRSVGEQAGFTVYDDFLPPRIRASFAALDEDTRNSLEELMDPIGRVAAPLRGARSMWTGSKIDVAWVLPVPSAIKTLITAVDEIDPTLRAHGTLPLEACEPAIVVGFELESQPGKHAGGALLNLAAHTMIGVVASPTEDAERLLLGTQRTYARAFPMERVLVRRLDFESAPRLI